MTGTATLALRAALAEQPQEEQQCLLDRHLLAALVDEDEPLGRAVEDRAEVGADRRDDPLRVSDACARLRVASRWSVKNPCVVTASTPSGPTTSGSTNEAAE